MFAKYRVLMENRTYFLQRRRWLFWYETDRTKRWSTVSAVVIKIRQMSKQKSITFVHP